MDLRYDSPHVATKISIGEKIHTIRRDENDEAHAGVLLRHCDEQGNNVYGADMCKGYQTLVIHSFSQVGERHHSISASIDDVVMLGRDVYRMIAKDGLTRKEFAERFKDKVGVPLKIIHWTDYRY